MSVKMKNIIRYIIFFPAAFFGSAFVSLLFLYMNPYGERNHPGTLEAGASTMAYWYCFYRISSYIIPEKGKKFARLLSLILCGIVIILSIISTLLFVFSKGSFINYELAMSTARTIGCCIAFYLIFIKE